MQRSLNFNQLAKVAIAIGMTIVLIWPIGAAEPLPDSWIFEAKAAWKELETSLRPCQVQGMLDGPDEKTAFEFKRSGDSVVSLQNVGEATGAREVSGRNEDYYFRLSRKTTRDPWVLRSIAMRSDAANPVGLNIERELEMASKGINLCQINVYDESIPCLFDNPGFSIKSSQYDARGLAEIRFAFQAEPNFRSKALDSQAFGNVVSGTLWLSPKMRWMPHSVNLDLKDGRQMMFVFEFDGNTGLPVTRELTVGSFREVLRYSGFYFDCKFLPEDFRLTGFGLPEPAGISPRTSNKIPWLLALGGVLVLAIALWSRRKRSV